MQSQNGIEFFTVDRNGKTGKGDTNVINKILESCLSVAQIHKVNIAGKCIIDYQMLPAEAKQKFLLL